MVKGNLTVKFMLSIDSDSSVSLIEKKYIKHEAQVTQLIHYSL